MFNSILVVCIGNICRSPIGERLLKIQFPNKTIESAGLKAVVDHPVEKTITEIALQHGISVSGHKAKQFNAQLCHQYDLILVMEKRHMEMINHLSPETSGKTMLFGHWNNQSDIADPYGKSRRMFELIYQQLSESADMWAKVLRH
ncbi:protein tyrosine phosphatase [Limnobaculum zhutongyuii]|uniref:protein-tyrosine-phosphatase n=1 Tax=Limnobaculum zhutongyuii TaxID=2498113 RepID=A0A411WRJ8_9GAMM|nr:protein tyrosine phosphatase [Limnobaculum zhutongyuii]QBH98625.1 protein tyrosine phosphatase [Limnobaculum zhutongyuii]TQS86429.1 protein tyrosine phosphatase [Limnobaculum zhutongyuii]